MVLVLAVVVFFFSSGDSADAVVLDLSPVCVELAFVEFAIFVVIELFVFAAFVIVAFLCSTNAAGCVKFDICEVVPFSCLKKSSMMDPLTPELTKLFDFCCWVCVSWRCCVALIACK